MEGAVAFFIAMFMIYPIPASLAIHRQVTDRIALTLINLLLGWTVIGWFAWLLWAALGHTDKTGPTAVLHQE
jgi:hypothetical protein